LRRSRRNGLNKTN